MPNSHPMFDEPRQSDPAHLPQIASSQRARVIRLVAAIVGVQAVAALTVSSFMFDGALILIGGFAGTVLMSFVSLPATIAAIGDVLAPTQHAQVDAPAQSGTPDFHTPIPRDEWSRSIQSPQRSDASCPPLEVSQRYTVKELHL